MADTPARRSRAERLANDVCPIDPDVLERGVAALERLAETAAELQPAAAAVHDLQERLDKLCCFLKRRGPWLLASLPLVLSAMGAITPEMAAGLKAAITALGGLG